MGRSQETYNKKEKEKKRLKKKQDKLKKKEERKSETGKVKSLEEMYAYVDEDGNLSSTPPDPNKKKKFKVEDIEIGVSRQEENTQADLTRKGTVVFFNESKGYGFIRDHETQESIFVHVNSIIDPVNEGSKVVFETERGQKGLNAINVRLS
jgi:cold shock CspA family protein